MRTKPERIKNNWRKIRRKLETLNSVGTNLTEKKVQEYVEQPHRLNKDKVEKRTMQEHTNNKTKRDVHANYAPNHSPKASDKRKEDAMDFGEKELLEIKEDKDNK